MKTLIIIFLLIIGGVFVTFYLFLRKQIKNITSQLNKINKIDTNSKILVSSSDKQIKELALEINKTLKMKQEAKNEYKRMDLEIRQSIANISHDLRTPLTSIMGYVQLMNDNRLSYDERKKYTNIVENRAKSLQTLISSFYDLSRLQSKEYKLEFESLNLSNIICDLIASFYNDFLNKEITPIIEIDEKVQPIIGDENAVRRIFSNLIQNTLKYGENSISIYLKQHKDYIITKFINNAPMLKQEDVSHLFERFFTADRTRSGKSTGLGLAITKELVEQMGHTIYAEFYDGRLSIVIKWNM